MRTSALNGVATARAHRPQATDRVRIGIEGHDIARVRRALAPRVRLVLDAGDTTTLRVHRRDRAADALIALAAAHPGARFEAGRIDGRAGAVLRRPGGPIEAAVSFGVTGDRIDAVWILSAPELAASRRAAA